MAFLRLVILLSLFYFSYAATESYTFCPENNGTILVELDAVISVNVNNVTTHLRNLNQSHDITNCGLEKKRQFEIVFEKDSTLKVILEEKDGSVYLDELEVKMGSNIATMSTPRKLSGANQAYSCNEPEDFSLDSSVPGTTVSVTFNQIKLQGFNVVDDSFSQDIAPCAGPLTSTTKITTLSTSMKPSTRTTSKAPTTSMKPSTRTTSKAPTTSTKPPTTSTKPPTRTTSKAPTTTPASKNITSAPTTPLTTSMYRPTTSAPSDPKTASLTLKKNGTTCLLVEFQGKLSFQYNKSGSMVVYTHVIDHKDVKSVQGDCSASQPFVKGILSEGCSVEFIFEKAKSVHSSSRRLLANEFSYTLSNVTVTYDTSKPPKATGGGVKTESSHTNLQSKSGRIYKCKASQTLVSQGSTTFTVSNLMAGAFSPDPSKVDECDADKGTNNVVPIVVGIILACLVVIIIVAYLIGRRRNREGYQSV